MKKVLFATTALVLTAGAAAAEVTVGGDGRMGIVYQEGGSDFVAAGSVEEQGVAQAALDALATDLADAQAELAAATDSGEIALLLLEIADIEEAIAAAQAEFDGLVGVAGDNEFSFSSRIRISFAATGETDNGLQFGGSIRADNASGGASGTSGNVFVSGAFGKLSMGDVDGAAQAAVGQVSGVGYTALGDLNEIGYISNAVDPTALDEYSVGAATLYASVDQIGDDQTGAAIGIAVGLDDYGLPGVAFAIAYETLEDLGDHIVAGVDAGFGDFTFKARYGTFDGDEGVADFDQYAISIDYAFGPATVTAFYKDTDTDFDLGDTFDNLEDGNYGIGAAYDLGGGAALKGGVVHNGATVSDNDIRADFGITMSF